MRSKLGVGARHGGEHTHRVHEAGTDDFIEARRTSVDITGQDDVVVTVPMNAAPRTPWGVSGVPVSVNPGGVPGSMEATMPDDEPLEVIFETADAAEVPVIKSLLDSADIPYLTRDEDQYDAFRSAFRGTVFNPRGRPVVFLVPASIAGDARMLLSDVDSPDHSD